MTKMMKRARKATRDATDASRAPILVVGASGYIGSRLVPELLGRGHRVRAMSRKRGSLGRRFPEGPDLAFVEADLRDPRSLRAACRGCRAIFYLAHSMEPGQKDFLAAELRAARNLAAAASVAGVERIIYLGALGEPKRARRSSLSRHLTSRKRVGDLLRTGTARVTELQASVIIGVGSASFELIRRVVERVPLIVGPGWLENRVQPIAVADALRCLVGCLERRSTAGMLLSLGGDEVLTYRELLAAYARVRGLRRGFVVLRSLSPFLGPFWLRLLTPLPKELTGPLVASLEHDTVCTGRLATRLLGVAPLRVEEAIRRALDARQRDAPGGDPAWRASGDPDWVAPVPRT